jgi:uncharacterized protein YegL
VNEKKKRITAITVSLVLHATILMAAFNLVVMTFTPPVRETGSLIRVKINSRKFAAPPGQAVTKQNQEPTVEAPEIKPAALNPANKTIQPSFERPTTTPPSAKETIIVTERSPSEVVNEKGAGATSKQPTMTRNVQSRIIATEEVLKDSIASSAEVVNRQTVKPATFGYGTVVKDAGAGTLSGIAAAGEEGLQGTQANTLHVPFDRKTNAADIKSFLGYELQVYEDPADHVKYFRLSIRVEDTQVTLPTIPKEIVFLVDASNSIGKERLEQFKKGILDCLDQLGLNDKFNVMVFKKAVVKFTDKSVERNPTNIGNATDFLKAFEVGSKTDVYDAVLKSIDLKDPMKPAYILLLSDGQPTEGVTNPQQIINQIARINKGRVPVFAFGGGAFVNQYLLDFLSFTNRGWAEFYPYQVSRRLLEMYNRIKDPVLLNLRYYVSGLDEKEIYPKLLPDFFRGSKFVLYGRFTGEKTFFLELLGDSQKDVKQYRISDDISSAPKGDREIARSWAFRKVYHLVSQIEYDKDNKALLDQINTLAKKFDLDIPDIDTK